MEGTTETWPTESTKQCSHGLTKAEPASPGPAMFCRRSSRYMLWLIVWCFCGTHISGKGCVSDSSVCSSDCFPPIGLTSPALIREFLPYIVSRFVLLGCYLLEFCPFQKRETEEELIWEGGEGVEGRKTLIGMYFKREESIFNLKRVFNILFSLDNARKGDFDM